MNNEKGKEELNIYFWVPNFIFGMVFCLDKFEIGFALRMFQPQHH